MGAIEHVPAKELTAFFEHAKTLLKPGGLFLNHGINSSDVKRLPAGLSFVDASHAIPRMAAVGVSIRVARLP